MNKHELFKLAEKDETVSEIILHTIHWSGETILKALQLPRQECLRTLLSTRGIGNVRASGIIQFAFNNKLIDWSSNDLIDDWEKARIGKEREALIKRKARLQQTIRDSQRIIQDIDCRLGKP